MKTREIKLKNDSCQAIQITDDLMPQVFVVFVNRYTAIYPQMTLYNEETWSSTLLSYHDQATL